MKKLAAAFLLSLASVCAFAQALTVPAQQKKLTDVLSKYNALMGDAPNSIKRDQVREQYYKAFCAAIPKGTVTNWVGMINTLNDRTPSKGINLMLDIHTSSIYSGSLGVMLGLGNQYAYGVSEKNTAPHASTVIPYGSPLYNTVVNLREGDTVYFSGSFIPYASEAECWDNHTSYISLFNFTSIKKISGKPNF